MVRTPISFGAQPILPLEIRLDSPLLVFSGPPGETGDAELVGAVILMHHETMAIRRVTVILEGKRKILWPHEEPESKRITYKQTFLCDSQTLFPTECCKSKPQKVCGGNQEWHFKFLLRGDLPESVEGLDGGYIVYTVRALVDRAGFLARNFSASQHVRVIRTLGRDALESLPIEHVNEDIWASKLSYKITLSRTIYIIGSSITVELELTPLRKGTNLLSVAMELHERVVLRNTSGPSPKYELQLPPFQVDEYETIVAKKEMEVPVDSQIHPTISENGSLADECFKFRMTLPLPRSLKQCRQDADTLWITIRHRLKTIVRFQNPEGHNSHVAVKNSVKLFISPNAGVSEDQTVSVCNTTSRDADLHDQAIRPPPPLYEDHQFDQLYEDSSVSALPQVAEQHVFHLYDEIDPDGYTTPVGGRSRDVSGSNTPLYARSRGASYENLTSSQDSSSRAAVSQELYSRLAGLDERRPGTPGERAMAFVFRQRQGPSEGTSPPVQTEDGSSAHHCSANGRQPLLTPSDSQLADDRGSRSRNNSIQGSLPVTDDLQARGQDYDMPALSRTPSYKTAVRSPAKTPISEDLPMYEVATSRSQSPAPQRLEGFRLRNIQAAPNERVASPSEPERLGESDQLPSTASARGLAADGSPASSAS